jgi:putative heme-binding domain-containing protein
MLDASHPLTLRQKAASSYARGWDGENRMLELLAENKIPEELLLAAAEAMSASHRAGIRIEAAKYFDLPQDQASAPSPSIAELIARQGDPKAGKLTFEKFCQSCHIVDGKGTDFGPGLSDIGSKLSQEALYASILKPEAGISFGYEGYLITLNDQSKLTGLIISRTASEITVKQIGGIITVYTTDQIQSIDNLDTSLMTPNLHSVMDQKELVDLVSYLELLGS